MYQSNTIVPTEQFENNATVHLHIYQYIRQNMKLRSDQFSRTLCYVATYIHTVNLTTLIDYLFICNVLGPIVTLRVAFCCILYNNNK